MGRHLISFLSMVAAVWNACLTGSLLSQIPRSCHIVIHDYRRGRYQLVKALFDIVEDGPQFRVMKTRRDLWPGLSERGREVMKALRDLNPDLAVKADQRPFRQRYRKRYPRSNAR